MDGATTYDDSVLSKLAMKKEPRFGQALRIPPVNHPRLAPGQVDMDHSSAYFMKLLPLETSWRVLDHLDIRSLFRLTQTSRAMQRLVRSLAAYGEVMRHAPDVIAAFGQNGLVKHHSIGAIRRALRSDRCFSCGDVYGGWLVLPLCERACLHCLVHNPALWVIPSDIAKSCFHLTSQDLEAIPTFHHNHHLRQEGTEQGAINVGQAKQLAINKYGSETAVSELPIQEMSHVPRRMRLLFLNTASMRTEDMMRAYRQAPLTFRIKDLPAGYFSKSLEPHMYLGVGTIRFPSLHPHPVGRERGVFCEGCSRARHTLRLKRGVRTEYCMGFGNYQTRLPRLYLKHEFVEHVRKCRHAQKLLEDPRYDARNDHGEEQGE